MVQCTVSFIAGNKHHPALSCFDLICRRRRCRRHRLSTVAACRCAVPLVSTLAAPVTPAYGMCRLRCPGVAARCSSRRRHCSGGVRVRVTVLLACDPPRCSPLSLFFAVGIVVRRHRCPMLSSTAAILGRCCCLCRR